MVARGCAPDATVEQSAAGVKPVMDLVALEVYDFEEYARCSGGLITKRLQ